MTMMRPFSIWPSTQNHVQNVRRSSRRMAVVITWYEMLFIFCFSSYIRSDEFWLILIFFHYHKTCRECSYEFCWVCFGDWKSHSGRGCNVYKPWDKNQNDQLRWFRARPLNVRFITIKKENCLQKGALFQTIWLAQEIDDNRRKIGHWYGKW